jgi:hypothetical protein
LFGPRKIYAFIPSFSWRSGLLKRKLIRQTLIFTKRGKGMQGMGKFLSCEALIRILHKGGRLVAVHMDEVGIGKNAETPQYFPLDFSGKSWFIFLRVFKK